MLSSLEFTPLHIRSLISGALPAGLTLSSGGQISGTPTTTEIGRASCRERELSTGVESSSREQSMMYVDTHVDSNRPDSSIKQLMYVFTMHTLYLMS